MLIKAIDPSYSRTGLAFMNITKSKCELLDFKSVSAFGKLVYQMDQIPALAEDLAQQIAEFHPESRMAIIEFPVVATRSGGWLICIQQALYSKWTQEKVYLVPSQAINSYTKNVTRSKTYIVNWVKERFEDQVKGINHDEASAVILGCLLRSYYLGEYKNTVKTLNLIK